MTVDRNLLDWYRLASPDQVSAGLDWYPEADALASRIHDLTAGRVSRLQACAVLAVLSPRCSWPDNKRAALECVLVWGRGGRPVDVKSPGVFGPNVEKAFAVLAGPDVPAVCDGSRVGARGRVVECRPVDTGCPCPVHGPKVAAFYRAISGTSQDGAMDIWATRAAHVNPAEAAGLAPDDPRRHAHPAPGEHATLAAAYRRAADAVGVSARSFQAIVWLSVRSSWSKSNGVRFKPATDIPF